MNRNGTRSYQFQFTVSSALIIISTAFCIYRFSMILRINSNFTLNKIKEFIPVMEKCCFLFEVRTEFLNIIIGV
jgi:hypothetical protein